MAIVRVEETFVTFTNIAGVAAHAEAFASAATLRGRLRNFNLPEIVWQFIDGQGLLGPESYPNGGVALDPFTFDYIDFQRSARSIGSDEVTMVVTRLLSQIAATQKVRRQYHVKGRVERIASGAFNRPEQAAETITFRPTQVVECGKNASLAYLYDVASKPTVGAATGALVYIDLAEGEALYRGDWPSAVTKDHLASYKLAAAGG